MLTNRKDEHLDIVLSGRGRSNGQGTGFDSIVFEHCALPELDLDAIDLATHFLAKKINAPLLVSSMTGGPSRAAAINANLARACEQLGIALAVGSQRVAIEMGASAGIDADLRRIAPTIPLLANFGAAQLNTGFGRDEALRAIDMIGADALIIHLNPLQEAVQPEGDRNWVGLLDKIAELARTLTVPVVAKEVGNGISGHTARLLLDRGIGIIDVAGAGGTSWAAVESERAKSPKQAAIAKAFSGWGMPTARAIADVRHTCPDTVIIGSGGIKTGIDAAKAIRLGADIVGQASGVLDAAMISHEAVIDHFETIIAQLRIACFCTGSKDLMALRQARLLLSA